MLGILALIVVGPKDLPKLMQSVGRFLGSMRKMADEFRAGFDQMAREAEIEEMRREIADLKKEASIDEELRATLDETDAAMRDIEKPDQSRA